MVDFLREIYMGNKTARDISLVGVHFGAVCVGALFFAITAVADQKEFRVSSADIEPLPAGSPQAAWISRLKQLAVTDFLKARLGAKFSQVEPLVTPEFAERFVIDYRVNRGATDKNVMELVGHRDTDALKRWVTLNEAKLGVGWKPAFVFSSTVPGLSFGPKESSKRTKDSAIGQAVLGAIAPALQRSNIRFLIPNEWNSSLVTPPRGEDDMRTLRSSVSTGGLNGAVWAHLSPCPGCGTKLDIYLYDLNRPRLLWARTDELKLEPRDFASSEKVKRVVREALKDFTSDFEDVLSSGLMTSHPLRVVVENLDSYRTFKNLQSEFSQLDFAVRSLLKKSSLRTAEFEIMTQLSTEEFAQRLQQETFPDIKLVVRSRDDDSIFVRASKI